MKPSRVMEAAWPAVLATKLGQECDIPVGSLWYPGFSRGIRADLANGWTREMIEADRRTCLGLDR